MSDVVYLDNLLSLNTIPDTNTPEAMSDFIKDIKVEVMARHWPALFWWALFDDTHIRTTWLNSTETRDKAQTPATRDASAEELSLKEGYPYLSAPTDEALRHWEQRMPALAQILPADLHPILAGFDAFLKEKFTGAYIILRTTELTDITLASGEDWRFMLRGRARDWQRLKEGMQVERLGADSDLRYEITEMLAELQAPQTDPFFLLSGRSEPLWPLPDLEAAIRVLRSRLLQTQSDARPEQTAPASVHKQQETTSPAPDTPIAQDEPEQVPLSGSGKNNMSLFWFIVILFLIFSAYFSLS